MIGHARSVLGDDERVWKHGLIGSIQPVKRFDWNLDLHTTWDVKKRSGAHLRFVQRRKFLPAEDRLFAHEIFAEQVRMSFRRLIDWQPDHTLSRQIVGKSFVHQKSVVRKDHAAGNRLDPARADEQIFAKRIIDGVSQCVAAEIEIFHVRESASSRLCAAASGDVQISPTQSAAQLWPAPALKRYGRGGVLLNEYPQLQPKRWSWIDVPNAKVSQHTDRSNRPSLPFRDQSVA
jgi:hypothetical protein